MSCGLNPLALRNTDKVCLKFNGLKINFTINIMVESCDTKKKKKEIYDLTISMSL